jgi:hypothetical protein
MMICAVTRVFPPCSKPSVLKRFSPGEATSQGPVAEPATVGLDKINLLGGIPVKEASLLALLVPPGRGMIS